MLRLKIFLPFILALSFLFFGYLFIAKAQESVTCPDISVTSDWFTNPSGLYAQAGSPLYFYFDNNTSGYYQININGIKASQISFGSHCSIFFGDCTQSGNLTLVVRYVDGSSSNFVMNTGASYFIETHDISSTKTINYIRISRNSVNQQHRFAGLSLTGCEASDGSDICELVENGHFGSEDGWLLDNGATITNSMLNLPVGGQAAQNLTLQSTTTYSAIVATAPFTGSTSLNVRLGTEVKTLEITGTGEFSTSFTTPSLSGPIAYSLENTGPDAIDLDFTCVILGSGGDGSQGDCIAPINGEFNTAENWTFLRGAQWNGPSGKALLPYPDVGLIVSSSTYSLPVISGTENLLIGFDARKTDNNETGALSGRVYAGSSVNWTFETYGTEYRYEASLNTLAGLNDAEIAFVNPGLTGSDLISSTSDVILDNVCVFVANRGPNLPTPTDPDAIPPVDLGFNYTSCNDVDGILAFFGVNIQQYRADYLAGASIWDPIGWVPWLIAAGWNILATWLCIFLAAFVSLVDLLQYFVNLFLNILNWMVRSFPAWRDWLSSWLNWLGTSLANLSNAYAAFLASWSDWIGDSLANLSDWIGDSLANLSDGLAQFLANWSDWIATSLANMSDWIGAELAAWSDWIGASLSNFAAWLSGDPLNALRAILNILIDAWNIYLAAFGEIISLAFDLLVYLWNMLVPFLSAVWGYIFGGGSSLFSNPLLALFLAVIGLLLTVVSWVWVNVFMVVSIPINFYYAFDNGVNSEAFAYLMTCAETNFWCQMLAGVQLVNQTSAHTLMYPIVIVGIIIGSIVVFWKELWALFTTPVS